jgi:hypothetical protein
MIAGSLFIGGKDWTGGEDLTCKSCDGSKKHNIQDQKWQNIVHQELKCSM